MSIRVIFGPMFSGKTSELIRLVKRFTLAQKKCLVIGYAGDTRYENYESIASHDRNFYNAVKVPTLEHVDCNDYDVVAIDEGQFFDNISDFCDKLARQNKIVIVAALDGTYERKPFGQILQLVPLADHITKLTAVCSFCKEDNAVFTLRTVNSSVIQLIGGAETYKACCRRCYDQRA